MTIELGGNIKLTGFRDFDPGSLMIVKKIVGNFVKKYSELEKIDELHLTVKPVHESEEKGKARYEIHGRILRNGKVITAEDTSFNLFMTLSSVLGKLENEMK